jgi:hypothetical protein
MHACNYTTKMELGNFVTCRTLFNRMIWTQGSTHYQESDLQSGINSLMITINAVETTR